MEKNIQTNANPGPGRPSLIIEVNFKDPQKSLDQIRLICKNKKDERQAWLSRATLEISSRILLNVLTPICFENVVPTKEFNP